jgi:hypothetical protein
MRKDKRKKRRDKRKRKEFEKKVYEKFKELCHDKKFLEQIDDEIHTSGSPNEYLKNIDKFVGK